MRWAAMSRNGSYWVALGSQRVECRNGSQGLAPLAIFFRPVGATGSENLAQAGISIHWPRRALSSTDSQTRCVRIAVRIVGWKAGPPSRLARKSAKPLMNGSPFSVVWRQITPWRSGAKNPEHSVDKSAVVLRDSAPLPSLSRQHWL